MKPRNFTVTWKIELRASVPLRAANTAREIHLDSKSIASVFDLTDGESEWVVDLLAPRRKRVRLLKPRNAER